MFKGWTRNGLLSITEDILRSLQRIKLLADDEVAMTAAVRPASEMMPLVSKTLPEIEEVRTRLIDGASIGQFRNNLVTTQKAITEVLEIAEGAKFGRDKFRERIRA
jgi:hypothetical protein